MLCISCMDFIGAYTPSMACLDLAAMVLAAGVDAVPPEWRTLCSVAVVAHVCAFVMATARARVLEGVLERVLKQESVI